MLLPFSRRSSLKSELAAQKWICVDLPPIEYAEMLDLQRRLISAKNSTIIYQDIVLILEHLPVFTIGCRGGLANLNVSEAFLAQKKIKLVPSERGGDITFHAPGQLVVYPIVDLIKFELKVLDYVRMLEEIMLRVVGDWGIKAERNPANRGVWINNSKLGSIGIAVRRGIAFHGLALNVNPVLEPFEWINPCGIQDCGVTSMARELSQNISVQHVRQTVKRHLKDVFGVTLVSTGLSELQELLIDWAPQKSCPNIS